MWWFFQYKKIESLNSANNTGHNTFGLYNVLVDV